MLALGYQNILTRIGLMNDSSSFKKLYSSFSDADLIILLKHNDDYAYTEIFEKYNEILLRHADRILTDKEEINDVVQGVF